ncbi:hypothetical protein IT401_01695 [Candidatus Nomurabacteria bacterium]|nr:hypothetical protein [Candidatus Nomurabacteria bacterium]
MHTHHHDVRTGTASLVEADITFFPLASPPLPDLRYFGQEHVLGFACLPSVVIHRLRIYEEKKQTFFFKNRPLEYVYFTYNQLSEGQRSIDEFWAGIIYDQQRRGFPKVFIIAPEEACHRIIGKNLQHNDCFYYYHHPSIRTDRGEPFLLSFCFAEQKICVYLSREFDMKRRGSFVWT